MVSNKWYALWRLPRSKNWFIIRADYILLSCKYKH